MKKFFTHYYRLLNHQSADQSCGIIVSQQRPDTGKKSIICAALLFMCIGFFVSSNAYTQTITTKESRCVNTGEILVNGIVGSGGPYQLSVTSYPSAYTSTGAHAVTNLPDTFAALFPGSYTIEIIDQSGAHFTYPNISITSDYILPGNSDYLPVPTAVTNCASPNGSIQGTLANGRAPYTYTIASGPAQAGTTNSTGTFTGLPAGNYQVQAADSCQNIQTRNITIDNNAGSFSIGNPVISRIDCSTFSLDALTVSPSFPAGGYYQVMDYDRNGGVKLITNGNTLPLTFTLYHPDDIQLGWVSVLVYDACGNVQSVQPNIVANDWNLLAANITDICAGGVVLNGITTTGTIPGPYTIQVKPYNPYTEVQYTGWQTVSGFPYTLAGVDATTNPLAVTVQITDACGIVKQVERKLSFSISISNLLFTGCSTAAFTVDTTGNGGGTITYTISPDPGIGSNTTGVFTGVPDGDYTITATDACGKTASYVLSGVIHHGWKASIYTGMSCSIGGIDHEVSIPGKSFGNVTITQYAGARPVTGASVVLTTVIWNANGYIGHPSGDISGALGYMNFPNTQPGQTYTYVVTDSCGFSDTLTILNPATGHQPMAHTTIVKNKCINKGDITASWLNDTDWPIYPVIRIWEKNTPATLLLDTAVGNTGTGIVLLSDLNPGNYVVQYSVNGCSSDNTFYDTVAVTTYTQPSVLTVQSFTPCSGGSTPVIVAGSGGISPYTYEIVNSYPDHYTAAPQTSPAFTLPTSQSTITVRLLDACYNSVTRTVALTKAAPPVIRNSAVTLSACTLPFNFKLYVDSVYDGSVFTWTKLTGVGAGTSVLSTASYLPLSYSSIADTGTYQVTVTVPNSCYSVVSTYDIANVINTCLPFISGNVFDDANGLTDATVNGITTNANSLQAVLTDANNKIAASTPVAADGTYNFINVSPGIYSVILTTSPGIVGNTAPDAVLPAGWISMGENIGSAAGNDGTVNGILPNIVVSTTNVTDLNFGIELPPVAYDTSTYPQMNPGGTVRVQVPTLNGKDAEDGVYDGVSGINTVIIKTLPTNGTLYYNNQAVTAGQTIQGYNPLLFKADPNDSTITMIFTYTEVDAAGVASMPATVKMPFTLFGLLPVQLINFTATAEDINVQLNWQTTTEINVAKFVIEHKTSNDNYTSIGQVQAHGHSTQMSNYTWLHTSAVAGVNYYRLKIIDNDGSYIYSDVKMVKTISVNKQVTIHPNPAVSQLSVAGISNVSKLIVYDLQGRLITTEKTSGEDNKTINVSGFPSGTYLITFIQKDGTIVSRQKFVKL